MCVIVRREGGGREGGRKGGRVGNRFSHKRLASHDLLLKSTSFPAIGQGGCL